VVVEVAFGFGLDHRLGNELIWIPRRRPIIASSNGREKPKFKGTSNQKEGTTKYIRHFGGGELRINEIVFLCTDLQQLHEPT
jgi:hypothetical protein